jgi:hypothetical protein
MFQGIVLVDESEILAPSRHRRGLLQIGRVILQQPVEAPNLAGLEFHGISRAFQWPERLIDSALDPFGYTDEKDRPWTTPHGIWLLYGDIPKSIKVFLSTRLEVHAIATAMVCQCSYWEYRVLGQSLLDRTFPLHSCSASELKHHTSLVGRTGHFRLGNVYRRKSSVESWFALDPEAPPPNAQKNRSLRG